MKKPADTGLGLRNRTRAAPERTAGRAGTRLVPVRGCGCWAARGTVDAHGRGTRRARRSGEHIGLHCTKARNSRKGGGAHLDVRARRARLVVPVVRWHSLASAPFEPHMPHL